MPARSPPVQSPLCGGESSVSPSLAAGAPQEEPSSRHGGAEAEAAEGQRSRARAWPELPEPAGWSCHPSRWVPQPGVRASWQQSSNAEPRTYRIRICILTRSQESQAALQWDKTHSMQWCRQCSQGTGEQNPSRGAGCPRCRVPTSHHVHSAPFPGGHAEARAVEEAAQPCTRSGKGSFLPHFARPSQCAPSPCSSPLRQFPQPCPVLRAHVWSVQGWWSPRLPGGRTSPLPHGTSVAQLALGNNCSLSKPSLRNCQ